MYVMLISKSILEEFKDNSYSDSTLFYFSTHYCTNYSLRTKRLLYTFLGSIFAVCYVALSPVRIFTGLCFVGTPLHSALDLDWATSTRPACGPFQLEREFPDNLEALRSVDCYIMYVRTFI